MLKPKQKVKNYFHSNFPLSTDLLHLFTIGVVSTPFFDTRMLDKLELFVVSSADLARGETGLPLGVDKVSDDVEAPAATGGGDGDPCGDAADAGGDV